MSVSYMSLLKLGELVKTEGNLGARQKSGGVMALSGPPLESPLTDECVTKSFLDKQLFSKLHKRVMTESFLKANAKTAFFTAIPEFCTAN